MCQSEIVEQKPKMFKHNHPRLRHPKKPDCRAFQSFLMPDDTSS